VLRYFDRYLLKEIFPPFFIGLLVSSFVLLMNQILLLSDLFISKGVTFQATLRILIYLLPSVLAFTIPMAVLMGFLGGLSRLSSDSEIMAFKTLGISSKRLLLPILYFSFLGWVLSSFLAFYLAPRSNHKWVQTIYDFVLTKVKLEIKPREFDESIPGAVIYIQDINEEEWQNAFIYFSYPQDEPRVILAKKGRLKFYPEMKRATLELRNGTIHSYPLSEREKYRVTTFRQLEEEIDVEGFFSSFSHKKRVREKDIKELFSSIAVIRGEMDKFDQQRKDSVILWQKRREYISHWIEVHKKFALPFACFIFAFLSLPLGAFTTKGGRTSGFTISIGIILLYYILITAGEKLAMDAKVSPAMGMWGPNILLLVGGVYLFVKSFKEAPFFSGLIIFLKKGAGLSFFKIRKFSERFPRISFRFPNILDRYLIRKYFFIYCLVFFSLLAIFIIVTFFERIDNIYEHKKSIILLLNFIRFSIPEFLLSLIPLSALTTTLLCLGLLTKSNEITAMKACGISIYRIVFPLILIACFLSFVSFYVQENILPSSNKKAEEIWNEINDLPPRSSSHLDRRWVLGKEGQRIYYYRYFEPEKSVFSNLSIFEIDIQTWRIKRRIYAERGLLKEARIILKNCWSRDFEGENPISFEKKEEMSLSTIEDRRYFLKEWKEPNQMTFFELSRYLDEIEARGFETKKFRVDLNLKLSFPLAGLIMTLLALPFAFKMGKKGTLVGIGTSLLLAIIYWSAIGIFKNLGYVGYLSPFFASWSPAFLFGLFSLILILKVRT